MVMWARTDHSHVPGRSNSGDLVLIEPSCASVGSEGQPRTPQASAHHKVWGSLLLRACLKTAHSIGYEASLQSRFLRLTYRRRLIGTICPTYFKRILRREAAASAAVRVAGSAFPGGGRPGHRPDAQEGEFDAADGHGITVVFTSEWPHSITRLSPRHRPGTVI